MYAGRLYASLTKGSLYAYFDAFIDLLVNYEPFHFNAEARICVGVTYTQDLLVTSSAIHTEIAAGLTLYGPPLAGRVYVDFWVFGFRIDFGPQDVSPADPLSLSEFYRAALQLKDDEQLQDNQAHTFSCRRGLMVQDAGGLSAATSKGAPWRVRSGPFCFSLACRFAIHTATLNQQDPVTYDDVQIYAKPMRLTEDEPLASKVEITIQPSSPGGNNGAQPLQWNITSQIRRLPQAVWGVCKFARMENFASALFRAHAADRVSYCHEQIPAPPTRLSRVIKCPVYCTRRASRPCRLWPECSSRLPTPFCLTI